MEKLKFICLTWNNHLPYQSIMEATCGYYAYSNLVEFSKVINDCNDGNIIENIKYKLEQQTYKISVMSNIIKYRKLIGKDMISLYDAYRINNYELPNTGKNISDYNFYTDGKKYSYFPSFFSNYDKYEVRKALLNKENCIYKFIIQSIYYNNMVDHMVPVIIQKIKNIVYIHILDSYCLLWNGDHILRLFYITILGKDITNELECKDISAKENIISLFKKLKEFINIVISLVVILIVFIK